MEERLKNYLSKTEELLKGLENGETGGNIDAVIREHLQQIVFFSHERLIHLIVTALFAILEVVSLFMTLSVGGLGPILLTVALLVLLIPYVRHYYILENGVQKMYTQYDRMIKLAGEG